MYLLANQWLKTAKSHPTGLATTFNTTLDLQDPQEKQKSKGGQKGKWKGKKQEPKGNKDMSTVECYSCSIMGQYASKCPHRLEKVQRKTADESEDEEDTRSGHVTWADDGNSIKTTYQVNSVSDQRFACMELILDNGADVSIVHPSLLRNTMPSDRAVKINGVRGHQFTVEKTGFLDPLFPVCQVATHL